MPRPTPGVVCNSPYVGYYGTLPTTVLGPDALSLDAALQQGDPGVRFDYVVLHVNAHDYLPEWLAQIARRYRIGARVSRPDDVQASAKSRGVRGASRPRPGARQATRTRNV